MGKCKSLPLNVPSAMIIGIMQDGEAAMKNPKETEQAALRERAQALENRLPAFRWKNGTLAPESFEAFRREAVRILRRGWAVGAGLVLCCERGEAVFCYGMARRRPRLPVTPQTCFRVASVSKLVLAVGFLQAQKRGLLTLDEDISRLLGYRARSPRFPDRPVTPRMLLTHTAALRDEGPYLTLDPENPPALRDLLRDEGCWRESEPGESFHYSNLGAGVAGIVLERAMGMPLDEAMRELVFGPYGIRAAYDPRRIVPVDDLACGYRVYPLRFTRLRYDAPVLAARPPLPFEPERDVFAGAGRMLTDTRGAAALLRLLCAPEERKTLAEMVTLQDGKGGIRKAGRTLGASAMPGVFSGFSPYGHQGVAYGMCSELFFDPQQRCGVFLMTNGLRLEKRAEPLVEVGFDLVALGFAALRSAAAR